MLYEKLTYEHANGLMQRTAKNLRFYILASSIFSAIFIIGYLRVVVPDDQIFAFRLEEIFGLISVLYWYVALMISPLRSLLGERGPISVLVFARRAIGVCAAIFALLHSLISLYGQLGGTAGLFFLAPRFFVAIVLGVVALLVLVLMAITSTDFFVRLMHFSRWKWLHRMGYGAGILALLHIWLIGTHVGTAFVQGAALAFLSVFFLLESLRVGKIIYRKHTSKQLVFTVVLFIFCVCICSLIALKYRVGSYATDHKAHAGQVGEGSHEHP